MKNIIRVFIIAMVLVLVVAAFTACFEKEPEPVVYEGHEGHKVSVIPAVAATCAKEGLTEGAYCADCREMIVEQTKTEKVDHVWVDNEDRDFTCTLDGYKGGKHCENCGIQDGNTEITKAHCVYGEPYVYQEPTCGVAGFYAMDCTVCGTPKRGDDIPATGEHNYTVEVEAQAPTCLDGYTAHKACEVCGAKNDEYEVVPGDKENGHHFAQENMFYYPSAPTCTEGAYIAGYCTYCEKGYLLEPVPATGHKDEDGDGVCDVCEEEMPVAHEHVWSEATCTEPAKCECGETQGEALGHTWTDATCTAPKTCSVCEATEGEALGHDYDRSVTAPTCTEAGYTTFSCGICDHTYTGEEVEATGHTLVDVEAKEATCAVAGYTAHKACDCGYTEGKEVVAATGAHADEDGNYKCDVCSTKMLPADGTALTISQALTIAKMQSHNTYTTQKYYITGIVTNVYNTTYGNLYLKDAEGNQICIYGLYSADGKTRYDAMNYKPVEGDELTVYTVLGMYNSTAQGKNAWMDEVVAHEHAYTSVVTDPTCTKAGYTTHTCTICNGYVVDTEVEALGHTTDNGVCERCELTIGGDVVNKETFTADFNTVTSTNSSYVSSTTTSGWKATNCAVMGGGTSDANPKFKVFGDAATRAFTLNGKTSAKGSLVSPTLTGGLSKITFNYTNCFSESNGVDITITIKQNGTAVATKRLDQNSVTKLTAYTFEWDLEAEGVAVTGDFTIEITNNCPSNTSSSNKDRVSIWNLEWTNNPEA